MRFPREMLANMDAAGYYAELSSVMASLPLKTVDRISERLEQAYEEGRTVFLCGNGGSAALASHFACDLGKGTALAGATRRFRVLALTDNIPLLSAWANDSSYENIFSEQLKNFVQPDDVVIGISCSGNSPNVLRALECAREAGAFTIGLGGFQGGKMKRLCDIALVVPSNNMQIIEDLHLSIAHCLFTILRNRIEAAACNAVAAQAP